MAESGCGRHVLFVVTAAITLQTYHKPWGWGMEAGSSQQQARNKYALLYSSFNIRVQSLRAYRTRMTETIFISSWIIKNTRCDFIGSIRKPLEAK
jgi:hypothetical protein